MIKIVLFEPEKPANTGNIIRTCQAFNASLTIIGNITFDLSDEALRRAQMDYAIGFNVEREKTIDSFLKKNDIEKGYFITRYGNNVYSETDFSDYKKDIWLMFGKESTGIPLKILNKYQNRCLRIPIVFSARSLNLANSVSIIISEIARQQNFHFLSIKEEIKTPNHIKDIS